MKYVITALVLTMLSSSSFAIQPCDRHSQRIANGKCAKLGSAHPASNCQVSGNGSLSYSCQFDGRIVNFTSNMEQVPEKKKVP
jgi:hypothetical protein